MRQFLVLCAVLTLLSACGTPGANPSGTPSSTPSGNPNNNSGSASASGSVTATRQAYGAYLNCLHAAHPGSGAGAIANVVLNVYTDAMWVNLKAVADSQVQVFTKSYGKECGA